jgi:hypothetical protein
MKILTELPNFQIFPNYEIFWRGNFDGTPAEGSNGIFGEGFLTEKHGIMKI